nr:radical SAM protein [Desulfobulbaceae bacterium]
MSQLIIPIFITHQGCPHRCSFCNQAPVTGTEELYSHALSAQEVVDEIATWLQRSKKNSITQVAFYGGSFTGLPENRQIELLEAVQPFINRGQVTSIRISTRPDYITDHTAIFLKRYNVDTVEIGVQSLNQIVLDANFRGHTTRQVETALHILKKGGFRVGAQLLLGLPGDSTKSAIHSAKYLAKLGPHFARLYPALVLKGSALESMYTNGQYRPLSLHKAIALCSRIKTVLEESNISVIRMGLQPSRALEASVIAGPYHPALGELVLSRAYFKTIRKTLTKNSSIRQINASARDQSIILGQKKSSINRLNSLRLLDNVTFNFNDTIARGTIDFA